MLFCQIGFFTSGFVVGIFDSCVFVSFWLKIIIVDNLQVVASIVLGTKSAQKRANALSSSATAADNATNIFWINL